MWQVTACARGLIMMMLQSIVSALVRHNPWASPRDLLRTVNAVIYENIRRRLGQDEHATLTLFRLDAQGPARVRGCRMKISSSIGFGTAKPKSSDAGTWGGCGSQHRRAGTVETEAASNNPETLVLLYTDGLTEAMDENQQVFGIDRLCAEFTKVG